MALLMCVCVYHMIYSLSSIATPVHGMSMYTTRDHAHATITLSDANQAPLPVKHSLDGCPVLSGELTKSVTSLFSTRDIWVDKSRIQLGKLIKEGMYVCMYEIYTMGCMHIHTHARALTHTRARVHTHTHHYILY